MATRERLTELVCESAQMHDCAMHCNHPPCYMVQNIADHLIANGVTVQEWYPASEPPKAEDNPVLVDCHGMVFPAWYHASTQEWETYGGMRETPRQWMKMPKPPKGVE